MPVPPPVAASQRYPLAIRDFVKYQNQPQDGTKVFIIQNPDGTTTTVDLTLDSDVVTKDLHAEITSLEKTVGAPTFLVPKTTDLGSSIRWLYYNKSTGRVDARRVIAPPPLPSHNHYHQTARGRPADDHPQSMRVDGSRHFTAPVSAPSAAAAHQLITLSQAKTAGINSYQVEKIINSTLADQKLDANDNNITGPDNRKWKMAGGVAQGYTDINGSLWVDLTSARFSELGTFVYMKMPFPGESMLGWYAYQYMEDQLVLLSMDARGAWIQFIEDIRVDRQALVCLCWMALGI